MGKAQDKLHLCNNCKEFSVVRRTYLRKHDNRAERLEYCLNKSCGYKMMLPFRTLTESEIVNA